MEIAILKYRESYFEIRVEVDPYEPANFNGHPDSWTPAEGGGITDILSIENMDTGAEYEYKEFLKLVEISEEQLDRDIHKYLDEQSKNDYENDMFDCSG